MHRGYSADYIWSCFYFLILVKIGMAPAAFILKDHKRVSHKYKLTEDKEAIKRRIKYSLNLAFQELSSGLTPIKIEIVSCLRIQVPDDTIRGYGEGITLRNVKGHICRQKLTAG